VSVVLSEALPLSLDSSRRRRCFLLCLLADDLRSLSLDDFLSLEDGLLFFCFDSLPMLAELGSLRCPATPLRWTRQLHHCQLPTLGHWLNLLCHQQCCLNGKL
jgi:hypothetical protein